MELKCVSNFKKMYVQSSKLKMIKFNLVLRKVEVIK